MSVARWLRRNDPAGTSIYILLHRETSNDDLAQALAQNPFVTEVHMDLVGVQQTDWDSLMRVIATRANLEKVKLWDTVRAERRHAPAALVCALLHAIQRNTAIRNVQLQWLCLPTNISTFLDNASSITSFCLDKCDMESSDGQQGARSLAAALQRNTNIETLRLMWLKDIYAVPILEVLGSNTSVKTFVFTPVFDPNVVATSHALQRLLESTTSIQKFELRHKTFRERLFHPIAQGIVNSECVSELKFWSVGFQDRESFAQLRSILQNKRNLTSLCLHECRFGGGQVHEDIVSLVSQPDSLLRCFEFESCRTRSLEFLERVFPRIPFEALLRAIEKSKLERFKIGRIETPHQLQTLTQSIPSMRIRELEVTFWGQLGQEPADPRQNLLLAIKNNFSLRSVKGEIARQRFVRDC